MYRIVVTGGSGFIGTHLINKLILGEHAVVNIDIRSPSSKEHESYWRECDIKDRGRLLEIFSDASPTHVIHLAAKANLQGKSIEDFPDNVVGTDNLISAVNQSDEISVFVNTSTQYVVRPGVLPKSESFLDPYTAYGESKAAAETLVREKCRKCWVTIRPTNIWGPGHPFFPYELWRYLQRRYYIHPGFAPIKKYYGYVENAVNQILGIVFDPDSRKHCGRVYYIADPPIDNARWLNEFSIALSGKKIRRVPLSVWSALARVGDLLNGMDLRVPVSSERLFRLSVNESIPEKFMAVLPQSEIVSLEEGVRRCVGWYRAEILGKAAAKVRDPS